MQINANNKKKNQITFKIRAGYYLKLLTAETMKLIGSTKIKKLKIKMVKICLI